MLHVYEPPRNLKCPTTSRVMRKDSHTWLSGKRFEFLLSVDKVIMSSQVEREGSCYTGEITDIDGAVVIETG